MVLIFPSVLLWVWAESPGLFFIYVPPGYRQADIRHGREVSGSHAVNTTGVFQNAS